LSPKAVQKVLKRTEEEEVLGYLNFSKHWNRRLLREDIRKIEHMITAQQWFEF
jgi:hypothetical protein